ncbi:lytic murein transglycosylase, partial [Escherichia coli]
REVATRARAQGVSERTIDAVLPTLTYNPRVVELDRQQPGASTTTAVPRFAPYRQRHVDAARINRGRTAYAAQRPRLASIERQTGVP